tara:strand:- start:2885 stop:3595 length:711 start_codon:yes stop_codon:yes gene_type:complete
MKEKVLHYIKKKYHKLKGTNLTPPKYKQELLLIKALKEKGIDSKKLDITCNHDLGKNYVNGIELGIKYPDSFYGKAQEISSLVKRYSFYFNGFIDAEGGRKEMLERFEKFDKAMIVCSEDGRNQNVKDSFNIAYFSDFAQSKFGLCPHQLNWPGNKECMWTYRFIESCFVGAIPVVFEATPLGKEFTNGFHILKDSDFNAEEIPLYDIEKANENLKLAKARFFITNEELQKIKFSI